MEQLKSKMAKLPLHVYQEVFGKDGKTVIGIIKARHKNIIGCETTFCREFIVVTGTGIVRCPKCDMPVGQIFSKDMKNFLRNLKTVKLRQNLLNK